MAFRNLINNLKQYARSVPNKFSQSPLNDHMLKAMDSYESYIGVKEIKKIQQNVLKAEEAFIESSKARRTIQDGLLKVQQNLKQIRSKLDSMSRSDEAYLELITNEHKLLKNEMSLLNELRTKEGSERELFTSFSQRLREAHETNLL
ncbi:coiled-coil domain-containing protein 51 isoform X2 [Tetranychus urticae]|uniref:coiled-coil domain-containing protein 51 isoform X2 n=1 Tax=Tetranychus urticae TaxID=32264 RepID=UPI000D647651|nr:coiled-coil domain-containing protein 51 isoform X2 [Tetranychus urticae]